jgi:hypothetical protein
MDIRVTEGPFSNRLLQVHHLAHVGGDRDDHLTLRIGRPCSVLQRLAVILTQPACYLMAYLMRSTVFLYRPSKTKHLNAYQAVWFNISAKRYRGSIRPYSYV